MQIQPILGYFCAIFGLYQPPSPPFWIWAPLVTYPGSTPDTVTMEKMKLLMKILAPLLFLLEVVFQKQPVRLGLLQ